MKQIKVETKLKENYDKTETKLRQKWDKTYRCHWVSNFTNFNLNVFSSSFRGVQQQTGFFHFTCQYIALKDRKISKQ